MKVLVTVKEIVDVEDEFEIGGLDVDEQYVDYDINEWDDYAVEEAVQISEETDDVDADVEVVSATIGPERSEETVRMALAKGVDRAIRVWDDGLAEEEFLDVGTKADVLAAVVEEESPDIVLTGVQAGDDANGATGVALADRVGYEWAAVVNALELDLNADAVGDLDADTDGDLDADTEGAPDGDAAPDSSAVGGGVARVRRELEGGVEELTDVELPAVLTIQTGINEPRYASLRGIRQAQQKPLDHRTLADIGLDEGVLDSPIERTSMYEPEAEGEATLWEGDAGETAGKLADFLRDKGVVEG